MKKIILIPILLLFLTSLSAQSQIGGELLWECTQSNNYRFTLNVFYDCGRTGGILDSFILQSNAPGFNDVVMYKVSETEITRTCKTPSSTMTCSSPQVAPNMGAVKQVEYTTDSTNPLGVSLTGTPPASGYLFQVKIRNARITTTNCSGQNLRIRSIMRPYKNQSVDVCFDNSPVFEEPPHTLITCGHASHITGRATDKDSDDLIYKWANPLGNTGTIPYPFQPPLGTNSDIDSITGIIFEPGGPPSTWTLVYKVESYRYGIKTAEIYRDYIFSKDHLQMGEQPDLYGFDSTGLYLNWSETICAGTNLKYSIEADYGTNLYPGSQVELYSISEHYDSTMNPSGCKNPPCATITPTATVNNPVIASSPGRATVFVEWKTKCNHFHDTVYPYNTSNTYQFHFIGKNSECIIGPAYRNQVLSVTVEDKPEIPAPASLSYTYDSLLNILHLNWSLENDSVASFNHYQLWGASSASPSYQLIDSIFNIQTTSYQINLTGITDTLYYFVKTISGCNNSHIKISQDTLVIDASTIGIKESKVEKDKFTISPNPSSGMFTLHFQETMEVNNILIFNDQGQLVKSLSDQNTTQGNSISIDLRDQKAGKYYVALTDSSGRKYNSVLLLVR